VLGDRRYLLRRCASCGSAVTVGEIPPGLYETGAYAPGDPHLYRLARPVLRTFDAQRLELLRTAVPPPARLLDAGAGRGRFVAVARAAGYDAIGIEPSERGVGAASAIGIALERATIADAQMPAGSVDAVAVWHVLEHLDEPRAALSRMRSWLRPAGAVLIGVPNLASVQAKLGGSRWFHLDVPRHRVHFTASGLHALLESEGFAIEQTTHVLLEHNPFGMWQSLVNRLTRRPSFLYNLLKRNAPWRSTDLAVTAATLPLAPGAALAELLAGLVRRGGTIAVVARRME
jgi:SAM-dependent methyltransferase